MKKHYAFIQRDTGSVLIVNSANNLRHAKAILQDQWIEGQLVQIPVITAMQDTYAAYEAYQLEY